MAVAATKPISQRLEDIRAKCRMSLAEFHRRVNGTGYSVSYPTVQNYHHDRDPPVGYLAAVGEAFGVDPAALAFGSRAPVPHGTSEEVFVPGDPTDRVHHDKELEFLGFGSRFYGHLRSSGAVHERLMQMLDDFWERLPVEWDRDGPIHAKDILDGPEAHDLTMLWLRSLDDMLADAWAVRQRMLDTHHSDRPADTLDERLRFMRGVESALVASLPDRGRPDLPRTSLARGK